MRFKSGLILVFLGSFFVASRDGGGPVAWAAPTATTTTLAITSGGNVVTTVAIPRWSR